ncbi:MAG: hypothetical protein GXC78_00555 [Chitinophagaceae bacterium]|nr:hypothetical protein [Chitinophagaceae bacterium]
MKRCLKRSFFLLFATLLLGSKDTFAQNLTGIWRGYFKTDLGDTYKLEIQIKQSNNGFKGVTYSYLTTVFYGKATLTGTFNKAAKSAVIRELQTVELRMSAGSVPCIMKYMLEYSKSGKEEFLEGVYNSIYEKDAYGGKRGDDCGGGIVRLRKVPTSDFYIEPFLRPPSAAKPKTPATDNNATAKTPATTPPPKTTTGTATKPVAKPPVTNNKAATGKNNTVKTTTAPKAAPKNTSTAPNQSRTTPVQLPSADSVVRVQKEVSKPLPKPVIPRPEVLKTRQNELMKALVINHDEVTIKIFDNGEIDDDTISVYLDNKLMLSNKRLTASPLTFKFKLNEDDPDHELVMVAENLGRIPPNTSLMIVEAGDQRFEVRITSTEQKNAVVRFRYEKK